MCPSCGSNFQCDCAVVTTPYCSTCLKDTTCDVKINAKCVFYHLDNNVASNLTCLGIGNIVNLEAILEEIDEKLCSYQALETPLVATDSTTVDFTTSGTSGHNLTAVVKLDSVTGGNSLVANANGLYVPAIPTLPTPFTFDNGLTKTVNNVQLGGALVQDTTITSSAYYMTFAGVNGSGTIIAPNEFWVYQAGGLGGADPVTYTYQLPNYVKVVGTTVGERSGLSYTAKSLMRVDAVTEEALLASWYPNSDSDSLAAPASVIEQSIIKAKKFGSDITANKIRLNSPTAIQTTGTLINGDRYQIISNAGGANFTASGALVNTDGTTFTANATAPNWGLGGASLEKLGSVQLEATNSSIVVEKEASYMQVHSPLASPNDFGLIRIANYGFYELQLFKDTNRNATSYTTEAVIIAKHDNTGERVAQIGVSTPTTNNLLVPEPAETDKACYTQWVNETVGETKGQMINHSPFTYFLGIAGVNSGNGRVGINTVTPTAPLDIASNVTTAASFRIRQDFTPASAAAVGNAGDISWDADYIYICIATNTWKRVAIATW